MKHSYNRPTVEINNWLVSKEDIKRIYDFICERLGLKNIEIELETEPGNNRTYQDYPELEKDLPSLEVNKEIVSKIMLLERVVDKNDNLNFKQIWLEATFQPYAGARFYVLAGDRDGKYKDWVAGTYEQMGKLGESFEVRDKEVIAILKKQYKSVVFDPNKKITDAIKEQVKNKDKKSLAETNSNRKSWWENTWIQLLFVFGAIAGLVGLIFLFRK